MRTRTPKTLVSKSYKPKKFDTPVELQIELENKIIKADTPRKFAKWVQEATLDLDQLVHDSLINNANDIIYLLIKRNITITPKNIRFMIKGYSIIHGNFDTDIIEQKVCPAKMENITGVNIEITFYHRYKESDKIVRVPLMKIVDEYIDDTKTIKRLCMYYDSFADSKRVVSEAKGKCVDTIDIIRSETEHPYVRLYDLLWDIADFNNKSRD